MLTKSKAIVIKSLKYSDKKLIVELLTEEHGRISSAINISERKGGKFRKQMFQPLTLLTIETDYRQNVSLQRITDARIEHPCISISCNAIKASIGMFLAEVLHYVAKQEAEDRILFSFVENSILYLDAAERGVANFHIAFLVRLIQILGFLPDAKKCDTGNIFDLHTAEFTYSTPSHRNFLKDERAQAMRLILRMTYNNMHLFQMTREQRRECLNNILLFYRIHLPSFPEPKSVAVLQEVFGR